MSLRFLASLHRGRIVSIGSAAIALLVDARWTTAAGALNVGSAGAFTASLAAAVPVGQVITATAIDASDTDGDGIPNAYEAANGLNPNVNDAGLDADGDGLTNGAEFRAGTNPQSATSRLAISAVTRTASDFNLSFISIPGKTYRVETKESLLSPDWILLSDQIFATGTSTAITDLGAANLSQRHYRVSLEP